MRFLYQTARIWWLRISSPAGFTTVTGVAGRAVIALMQLMLARSLLSELGSNHYAAFVLVSSLMPWFLLGDFGLSTSLQNYISEAIAQGRPAQAYKSAAILLGMGGFLLVLVVLVLIAPVAGPLLLAPVDGLTAEQKGRLFLVGGTMLACLGIGNIPYKIWYAQSAGYISNIVPVFANIAAVVLVYFSDAFHQSGQISWALIAVLGPLAFCAIACFFYHAIKIEPKAMRWSETRKLAKRAIGFWIFGVMASITLQIDYVVLSQNEIPEQIINYSLHQRIFGLAMYVHTALMAALWPVFAEKIAAGNWASAIELTKKILKNSMVYALVVCTLIILLYPFIVSFVDLKNQLIMDYRFTLLYGTYCLVQVYVSTLSTVLQSKSDIGPFILLTPIQAAISIGLLNYLSPLYGAYGVVIGLILSAVFLPVWVMPLRIRHLAKREASA